MNEITVKRPGHAPETLRIAVPITAQDSITIQGYTFKVPRRFEAGHECSAAEAEVLTRAFHKNLRTNFADRVAEDGQANYDHPKLQAELTAYALAYSFGGPDPALAEAAAIALDIVKRAIKTEGRALKDFTQADLRAKADELLHSEVGDDIRKLARERSTILQRAAKREAERLAKENGNG